MTCGTVSYMCAYVPVLYMCIAYICAATAIIGGLNLGLEGLQFSLGVVAVQIKPGGATIWD